VASRLGGIWKLGQLLAKVERGRVGRPVENSSRAGKNYFVDYLKDIGLNKNRANECERIAALSKRNDRARAAKPGCQAAVSDADRPAGNGIKSERQNLRAKRPGDPESEISAPGASSEPGAVGRAADIWSGKPGAATDDAETAFAARP
jgi:hypothetical protein